MWGQAVDDPNGQRVVSRHTQLYPCHQTPPVPTPTPPLALVRVTYVTRQNIGIRGLGSSAQRRHTDTHRQRQHYRESRGEPGDGEERVDTGLALN